MIKFGLKPSEFFFCFPSSLPPSLPSFLPVFVSLFLFDKGNVGCVQSSISVEQVFPLCVCVCVWDVAWLMGTTEFSQWLIAWNITYHTYLCLKQRQNASCLRQSHRARQSQRGPPPIARHTLCDRDLECIQKAWVAHGYKSFPVLCVTGGKEHTSLS